MVGEQALTAQTLEELVEKARLRFSTVYIPLLQTQKDAIKKCSDLIAMDRDTITRNTPKKRAHILLTDIWDYNPSLFILCALGTGLTKLGSMKPANAFYVLCAWWEKVDHPNGLKEVLERDSVILPVRRESSSNKNISEALPPTITATDEVCRSSCKRHFVEDPTQQNKRARAIKTGNGTDTIPRNELENSVPTAPETSINFTRQERAIIAFEGVIFFVAESIPEPKEREAWVSASFNQLQDFKRLSCVNTSSDSEREYGTEPISLQAISSDSSLPQCSYPPTDFDLQISRSDTTLTEVIEEVLPISESVRLEDEGTKAMTETTIIMENEASPRGLNGTSLVRGPLVEYRQRESAIPSERQIEYKYSEIPTSKVHLLGGLLIPAIETSKQWKWERGVGGRTTDCLNILSPKNRDQDISMTMVVGFEVGMQIVQVLEMSRASGTQQ